MQAIMLNRRHFVLASAASLVAGATATATATKGAAAETASRELEAMIATLQGLGTISFTAAIDYGASAGRTGRRTLGPTVQVVFERAAGRLLVTSEQAGGLALLAKFGEATLFSQGKQKKAVLKPVSGLSAFAVPGLFLPFLGLLDADVAGAMFGRLQSVTPLAQGTAGQPEQTVLAAVMSNLFTGEIWVRNDGSTPSRIIGTFFEPKGGTAASASITITNWSGAAVTDDAFAVPGLGKARVVKLSALEI